MNKKLEIAHKEVHKMSRIKSSFIQHVTHELRTPLNSVVGFSTLIAEGGLSSEEAHEYSEQVGKNSVYLLGLIENIIDIADMDSQTADLPKKEVDVNACCHECIDAMRQMLQKEVQIELILPSANLAVLGVRLWMKRVLAALLDNAAKFTEHGTIRLICEEDKVKRVIRFVVEDTGIGVQPENKDAIFDRFFKEDSFTPGTGLGLSIANQIMDIVNGKIYLDTSYSGGARIIVEWPLTETK